jgi:hypothetical protein
MRSLLMSTAVAAALALSVMGSAANAVPINVEFNFVPTATLTANTGDVTNAATITSGAPDIVTSILANNVGLVTGQNINLTDPTPVLVGSIFTKSFATAAGAFLETLTVTLVTPGASSLGITATGTITGPAGFDPTPVFYSAAYTQNQGPGTQINASFNDATVPGPIVGAGLPGLMLAALGLVALGWRRRQRA